VDQSLNTSVDKLILIIGSNNLQNRLLASFLAEETGVKCLPVNSIGDIGMLREATANGQGLTLWDCIGKDQKAWRLEFEVNREIIGLQNTLALFNVKNESGIEEEAFAWGARGFFYEEDPLPRIAQGVQASISGEFWLSRRITTRILTHVDHRDLFLREGDTALTTREKEILAMIAAGSTNSEIAEGLFISHHTVKSHLYNIFKKIGVPNRLQAAFWAARNLRVMNTTT